MAANDPKPGSLAQALALNSGFRQRPRGYKPTPPAAAGVGQRPPRVFGFNPRAR